MNDHTKLAFSLFFTVTLICSCAEQKETALEMKNIYPWCIVAFDSLERSPADRMVMLKEFDFTSYAYDWRDKHLNEMESEINLARENEIEIFSVWLWLNAKRDSIGNLSPPNDRVLDIVKSTRLKTCLWVSFNNNFFEGLEQEQAMDRAVKMISYIKTRADETGSNIALYNHGGWFGNINNQVDIIKALPGDSLSIVYNFHHGHEDIDEFPQIVKTMKPYLSAVNLNGMRKNGPEILSVGEGDHELEMIELLIEEGYKGPWGVLGHIENEDVEKVLERNIKGLNSLNYFSWKY